METASSRGRISRRRFLTYSMAGGTLALVGSVLPGVSTVGLAAGERRPFPQHVAYAAGTIKPSHVSRARLDVATTSFYDAWKARYLVSGCGRGRRYVSVRDDITDDTISVSEGHGYGMLISALMAGHDPQARTNFDGLYRFFKDHPSLTGRNLMGYRQVESCAPFSEPGDDGRASATDGDMDIAYALLLADKQWGSTGAVNYRAQARATISAIMARETNRSTFLPTLGDWVSSSSPTYFFGTRSSDFMPDHWRAYNAATGDARWNRLIGSAYNVTARIQTKFSPTTGLLPDFMQDTNTSPRPATPNILEGPRDGFYSYNACRDPWRLGTDYLLSGDARGRVAVDKMNVWIRKKTGGNPLNIRDGYRLNGANVSGAIYNEIEFVASFGVGAMVHSRNQAWLNSLWDAVAQRTIVSETYYGNAIKMLALIVMSGNWWRP